MSYKLFVDTNVYLDFLIHRGKEWKNAELLFELAENKEITIYTSSSSLINILYIFLRCLNSIFKVYILAQKAEDRHLIRAALWHLSF